MGKKIKKLANSTKLQASFAIFWFGMIPVAAVTGLASQNTFISYISLWALVGAHGAWWAASKEEED